MKVSFNPMVSSNQHANVKKGNNNTNLNNTTPVGINNYQNNISFGSKLSDSKTIVILLCTTIGLTYTGLKILDNRLNEAIREIKEDHKNAGDYVEQTDPEKFNKMCIEARGKRIDWVSVARELKDSIESTNINTSPKDSLISR